MNRCYVSSSDDSKLLSVYPVCRRILGVQTWGRVRAALGKDVDLHQFPDKLTALVDRLSLPEYIADMARIEHGLYQVETSKDLGINPVEKVAVNPTLCLIPVVFKNLAALHHTCWEMAGDDEAPPPEKSNAVFILIWRHPESGERVLREAREADLLALKMAVEEIDPHEAAIEGGGSVGTIRAYTRRAISQGILLAPPSRIRRQNIPTTAGATSLEPFYTAEAFTLQWHITQKCDLNCRHCYDRSDRIEMPFDSAVSVLDDFYRFCEHMHVRGQVSFTGGNPFLYPDFEKLYKAAFERGFALALLGNPVPVHFVESLMAISPPVFYQISLEGLKDHNDYIRGSGHFERVISFLEDLKRLNLYRMVMLTLTRDNLDQVLPLAGLLRDKVDLFTFNRLATVGKGAQLMMADYEAFRQFLEKYEAAAENNPIIGFKDNLFNIHRDADDREPHGGCTGFGCGAAFNFVAVLSDGEVHACRKFPSPIGNVFKESLLNIYQSDLAQKYRKGGDACGECRLNVVCRGCLAVTYSLGLDVFKEKDPYCFLG